MFKAVYAYLGEDTVHMHERVQRMIERVVSPELRDFNYHAFSPGDASPARIEEAIRSTPMGTGHRLVVVRNLEGFPSVDQEAMAELAVRLAGGSQEPVTVFGLLAPGLDRRRRPYKLLSRLDDHPNGEIIRYDAPKTSQLDGWVSGRARERGIRLQPGASQAMVDLVGDDLALLEAELTKAELYAGPGEPVDVEAIEACVGRRRGESPWDLPRLFLSGQQERAQQVMARLLKAGERPHFLLNVLSRQVLELYQVALMMQQGMGREQIVGEVGIKPWVADATLSLAGRINPEAYPVMLEALKECDRRLKSRTRQDETLLQWVCGHLVTAAQNTQDAAGRPVP